MLAAVRKLTAALLFAVFCLCVYRARIQALTVDEAFVFELFVNKDLQAMAESYDACNHVLHTLLMKFFRWWLGGSELVLRLPSLLGAALYCVAIYRLTTLLLSGWVQPVAALLLTLNPLIFDFLVAGRGYGLAMALFLWAMYCAMIFHIRGRDMRWLGGAGILAGLSMAANLTMLVPAAALGFVLLVLALRKGRRGIWTVVDAYGGPAVVTAFLFLIIPLLAASRENFYYGATSLFDSARSLVRSAVKVQERWPFDAIENAMPLLVAAAGAIMLLLAVALLLWTSRFLRSARYEYRLVPFLLTAGTAVVSTCTLVAANLTLGVRYPEGRTGLYFIPLVLLAVLLALRLASSGSWRLLRATGHAAAGALLIVFLIHVELRFFKDWRFDAGTRRLMLVLRDDVRDRQVPAPVRLGANLFLRHTAGYYRLRAHMDWLTGPQTDRLAEEPQDYYILLPEQRPLAEQLKLHVIQEDGLSGAFLARRNP